jgi:hypothetical protein
LWIIPVGYINLADGQFLLAGGNDDFGELGGVFGEDDRYGRGLAVADRHLLGLGLQAACRDFKGILTIFQVPNPETALFVGNREFLIFNDVYGDGTGGATIGCRYLPGDGAVEEFRRNPGQGRKGLSFNKSILCG